MEQNKIPHIIVDTREQKLSKILDSKKDRITYENKQLDIADVVVSDEVAIERKEGFDFVSSIMDNRLFEQIMRLQETYNTPILILEGLNDNVFENVGMKISSIYGALAFISYKLGIAVIPTRNIEDTAIVVERVAYREQIKDGGILLARKAPKGMSIEERRTFIIEGLVDIGPKKCIKNISRPDLIDHNQDHDYAGPTYYITRMFVNRINEPNYTSHTLTPSPAPSHPRSGG